MKLTSKRVCQWVARSQLSFFKVLDLRAHRSPKQQSLAALLRLMVVGIACGQRKLRHVEALSADMTPQMRKQLGVSKPRVSDTTLWETLQRTPSRGFREQLQKQVRRDLDRKAIANDLFEGGVASYDGKCAAWGKGERPNKWCQKGFFNYSADACWRLFTLRSCLTSSSVRPVLDQQILTTEGEATAFAGLFRRDVKQFPRLFRYVTADAGITSENNAQAVIDEKKHYLFALKKNHRWLHSVAINTLRDVDADGEYKEWYRGGLIVRQLFRIDVPDSVRFPGVAQFLCVTSTRIDKKGRKRINNRLFVTSVKRDELSPKRLLKLVRLHWGIENGPNWTADMVLDEDSHWPCKQGFGVIVQSWLNLLAYNLVSVFRAQLPKTSEGKTPWWRVQQCVYQLLIGSIDSGVLLYEIA